MRYLVFNTKGGSGKSLIAREIIAAPQKEKITIIEIDELNRTQATYADQFSAVIELKKENIKDLLILLNEHENVVIDVGVNNLSLVIQVMVEYGLFEDIDRVVIPMCYGRSDSENALKTYSVISEHCPDIMFTFRAKPDEDIEEQYPVFFNNVKKVVKDWSEKSYVIINDSSVFHDAQNDKKLVVNMAEDVDYKSAALTAKSEGDLDKFHELMKKELNKRAAKILVKQCIIPAYEKLTRSK